MSPHRCAPLLVVAIFVPLLLVACSQRAELCSNPSQDADCAQELEARMTDARVPGISVAIVENHRLVSQWAMGQLATDDTRSVSTTTPFQAGDISQTVTALGVLKWLQQQDISLDSPVNEGLNNWQVPSNGRWSGDDVTLRHLLSHRSGLTPTRFRGYDPGQRQPTRTAIQNGEFPANSTPIALSGAPGTSCMPSAAAYEVLSYWLEDQTQSSFSVWQGRSVFTPLNITARYRLIGLPAPAMGHDWQGNTLPGGYRRFVERASSGLWASPSDLARVLMEIMAAERGIGRVLTDSSLITEMLTPQGCGVGLGLVVQRTDTDTRLSASGSNPGYRTRLEGQLETGNGIVIMSNGDRGERLIDSIVEVIQQDYNW